MTDIMIKRGQKGILEFPCDVERLDNGNTLISDAGDETGLGSEIIEVDPSGQIVWIFDNGLKFAHSAKRLSNGNTLISDTSNNRILEVDIKGQIVFSSDEWGFGTGKLSDGSHLSYPNDAHLLDRFYTGCYLITDRNNDRCIIADRNGTVKWSYNNGIKHPHNCDMTDQGNIIIADSDGKKVIEVSLKKEIIWQYGDGNESVLNWPRDADRLADGNTLIADSRNSRILEVTPGKSVVWSYKAEHFANFYDCDKLKNGNVLVSDQQHQSVLEIDPAGNIVWQFRNYNNANTINQRIRNGSFKLVGDNGLPESWILYSRFSEGGGRLIWDNEASPRPCPGLEYDRHGVLCLQQIVAVNPGQTYRFAGTLKTQGLSEGSFAYLQLAFQDSMGGLIEDASKSPKGTFFTADTEWTEDSLEAAAPDGAYAVELRIAICGKGKVWAKNIMFF